MDEVNCVGSEDRLVDCNSNMENECSHHEIASVACNPGMLIDYCKKNNF